MKDGIVIAQAMDGQVRIHAARTTELVEEARLRHGCMPTSAAALGRTLTATAIMASDLKNPQEKVVAIINGHGPAGTILAQAKGNGDTRGFIGDPGLCFSREDGHLDVARAVGNNGTLTVVKDLGLKEPFSGVVQLQSGEIGIDFAYYYAISEQTPSIVGVGVLVETDGTVVAAGGFIAQLMPGASEEAIQACEKVSATMRPVSSMIHDGMELEEIIRLYFPDAVILEHKDVRWNCDCSRERFAAGIATLADDELRQMIADGKGAEVKCEYCGNVYLFDTADLEHILETKRVEHR